MCLKNTLPSIFKGIFLFLLFLTLNTPTYAADPEIGQGKPISATSQVNSGFYPNRANDGNQNSYWESASNLWPQILTVDLGSPFSVSQVTLKLPTNWGLRKQTITILGSLDNTNYGVIIPQSDYSFGSTDAVITFSPSFQRYIRLQISYNNVAPSAQISEFQIFGVNSSSPSASPSPSPSSSPSSNPSPTPSPSANPSNWTIKSLDVMKYTKDAVCNPPNDAFINTQVAKAKELGANYIAISTPYDNPSCGDSLALTNRWVNSARAQGLNIWHRHMGLSFEGLYGVSKKYNDDYLQLISNYIINNPTLFKDGDIFTPTPEPDTAGIGGVTSCGNLCAFKDNSDFNQWIRNAQLVSKLSFSKIGLPNMKIGYYGTSGFIVFGENNPDWLGKSFLEQRTVDSMGNIIAMDSYPESYGGNMATALDKARQVWPNTTFVIGEWGTINAKNPEEATSQINNTMGASKRTYVVGFNYWNLGPSGNEGLLNSDQSSKPPFFDVQAFFKGTR